MFEADFELNYSLFANAELMYTIQCFGTVSGLRILFF